MVDKDPICEHFLHSKYGDENTTSFHFRLKKTPDSIIDSFSLTCIWDGTCVMSGDLGPLMWQQNYHRGPTYGFPNSETGLSYFAEKCHNADHDQKTEEWSTEKAIRDLKEHFAESQQEDPGFYNQGSIDDLFNTSDCWDQYGGSEAGYSQMLGALDDFLPGGDWYEYRFGYDWDTHFVRKFNLLKSVAPLVLEAITPKPDINSDEISEKIAILCLQGD